MTDVVVIANSNSANDRLAAALDGIAQVGNRCPELGCNTLLSRRMDTGGTWEICPACGFQRLKPEDNRLACIGEWEEALDAQDQHEEATL